MTQAEAAAVSEQAHSCRLRASPKCWLSFLNLTSTFSLQVWYILSRAAVTGHATLVSISLYEKFWMDETTSSGVINSIGFVHCVAFVCML